MAVYWPSGTAENSKMPSALVVEFTLKAELLAFSVTCAPAIGRCCGSCTMPRTEPKIVASRVAAKRREAAAMSESLRNIFLSVLGRLWAAADVERPR